MAQQITDWVDEQPSGVGAVGAPVVLRPKDKQLLDVFAPGSEINDWVDEQPQAPSVPQAPVQQQVGAVEDVARSIIPGLARGATSTAMMLPELINAGAAGVQQFGRGMAVPIMAAGKAIGFIPQDVRPVPQDVAPWKPFYGSEDVLPDMYEPQTTAGKATGFVSQILGGAGAVKGLQKATAPKAPIATADEVKSMASRAYKAAEDAGGVLKPELTNKFVDDIAKLTPQTPAGKLVSGDSPFTKVVETLSGLRNQPLSLRAAQEVDEYLSDKIDEFTEMGVVTKQGKKLLDVQNRLRDTIELSTPNQVIGGKQGFDSLKQARSLWAASNKLRDIERIMLRAESAQVPATAIKQGFRTLLNNPNRMRGYTQQEKALIRKAANTGIVGDLLGIAGSRLNSIVAGATGGIAGTAAVTAGSMASRGAAAKLQESRANKVSQEITKRAIPKQAAQPKYKPTNPFIAGAVGASQ